MRRVLVNAFGGADQLGIESAAAAPRPGPGKVLADVEAAGVNYIDVMQRKGIANVPLPYTPGFECVGRVAELGKRIEGDANALTLGQRVAWINVLGSYAGQPVIPAVQAIPVPDSFSTARTLLFQAMTAQYLVHEYRNVQPGDRVLVHAAAGGVGQLLVQWLKHLGAWVVGTTSSEAKAATARAAGADAVITYGHEYCISRRTAGSDRWARRGSRLRCRRFGDAGLDLEGAGERWDGRIVRVGIGSAAGDRSERADHSLHASGRRLGLPLRG